MKRLILLLQILLSNTVSNGFNLVGNTYIANFKVPLISRNQNIQIQFLNDKKANLKLAGFISNEGYIDYKYNKKEHIFTYKADETIEKIMKKYLVSLYDINYNETTDTPIIIIKSKLIRFKQKIVFYRGGDLGSSKPPPLILSTAKWCL